MNRIITLITLFSILASDTAFGQYDDRLDYIDTYAEVSVREMHRSGIPASIKLAQAILESNAGRSELARKANNHFGIKCGRNWNGRSFHKKDDDYRKGRLVKSCFRSFKNPEASFIAHSNFLTDPRKDHRYGFLFEIDPTDYKRWARGLKRSGYATNPQYDDLLVDLIERYELYRYDTEGTSHASGKEVLAAGKQKDEQWMKHPIRTEDLIRIENEVEYVLAREGESIESIALQFDVSERRLLQYNEMYEEAQQLVEAGSRIYLQKKRRNYRGRQKFHRVRPGESMWDIAQEYGLRLDILYKRNRMEAGQHPAVGEQIRLRGRVDRGNTPRLRVPERNEIRPAGTDEAKKSKEQPKDSLQKTPHPVFDELIVLAEGNRSPAVAEPVQSAGAEQRSTHHTVRAGETLYSISKKYGVSVEQVRKWNELENNLLSIGRQLEIR